MMPYTLPGYIPVGLSTESVFSNSFTIFNPSYFFEIFIEINKLKKCDVSFDCREKPIICSKICVRAQNKLNNWPNVRGCGIMVPYSHTSYKILKWPSRPIRTLRYFVTCMRIRPRTGDNKEMIKPL